MEILAKIETLNTNLYDELCEVLVLKRIQDHEDYSQWSILSGRNNTFKSIFNKINMIPEFQTANNKMHPLKYDYLDIFKSVCVNSKLHKMSK